MVSSNLNSKLLRFHCVRPIVHVPRSSLVTSIFGVKPDGTVYLPVKIPTGMITHPSMKGVHKTNKQESKDP